MGVAMSSEELFQKMADGADTKTSQVGVEEYVTHFESMLKHSSMKATQTKYADVFQFDGSKNNAAANTPQISPKQGPILTPLGYLWIPGSLAAENSDSVPFAAPNIRSTRTFVVYAVWHGHDMHRKQEIAKKGVVFAESDK